MQDANETKKQDLLSKLKQATEFKQPSAEAQQKTWAFSDDDTPNLNIEEDEPAEGHEPDKVKPGANGKLSPDDIKNAAESGAAAVELLTSLLSEGIINIRYYRKFTDEEREKLNEEILDKDPRDLNPEEKRLSNKWNRLMEARDKKLQRVKQSETAHERLVYGFSKHAELTGKTIFTPGAVLGVTIAESLIKSSIEAFLD